MKTFIYSLFAVSLFSFVGCGGSEAEEFVGLWDVTGSTSINMQLNNHITIPTNEHFSIHEGIDSDIVISSSGCTMPANVKNGIASVMTNHTCAMKGP